MSSANTETMPPACDPAFLNHLTESIIGAAIRIHRILGPGLLESAYHACLAHELRCTGLRVDAGKPIPLIYRDLVIPCAYRMDLLVEDSVVVEVKAMDSMSPVHIRQLQTYLQLAECRVGLLLNFGADVMRNGIKRAVNRFPDSEIRDERG